LVKKRSPYGNVTPSTPLCSLGLKRSPYGNVTPEDNNSTVFSKGNSKKLILSIPKGNHFAPNYTVADNAIKKDQKIAKKNNESRL
jgi:hypothetical protein